MNAPNVAAPRPDSSRIRVSEHWRALGLTLFLLGSVCTARAQAEPAASASEAQAPSAQAAQPSEAELARARQLFQRGVALAEQGQYGQAATRFREALAIRPAAAVEYNLAAALYELGRYEEAFNRAQSVERDPEANESLRGRAAKLSRALYPHTARLTVTASSSREEDVVVWIDSEPLDPALMGVARAVAPGSHHIAAERQGQSISERDVQVPLRTAVIIDVSLIIAEAAAAQPVSAVQTVPDANEAPAAPSQPVRDDHEKRKRIRLWSGIAAGVLAVGAGVALAVVLSKDEKAPAPSVTGDFMPGVLTWK